MNKSAKGSGRTGGRTRKFPKDASSQGSTRGAASKSSVADASGSLSGTPPKPSVAHACGSSRGAALKPRPMLFRVLAVVVALWIALLLTIYFTIVLPARHSAPQPPFANDITHP